MTGIYRVLAKDGDYGYVNGKGEVTDYVVEFDTLNGALKEFLEWTEDADSKITLTFKPKKEKK